MTFKFFKKPLVNINCSKYVSKFKCFSSLVPGEPQCPSIKTKVPGPKSLKLREELRKIQYVETIDIFGNYEKSMGNYLVDADGNIFLDAFCQIGSVIIGYNHPQLLSVFKSEKMLKRLINRPALGIYPGEYQPEIVNKIFAQISPCLPKVHLTMCGTCAVEDSLKNVFLAYSRRERGGRKYTEEEKSSAVVNKPPGSSNLTMLSFMKAYHGRAMGALSLSHSKFVHKIDIPTFDWPVANFPQYKYPLEEYERENKEEDKKCLEEVEDLFHKFKKKGRPIAGVMAEPIEGEGGNVEASDDFFRNLQKIVKSNNAYLMFDEVQTGAGPTGKFWAHEHFGLESPPDVVCFGKRLFLGGYFHTEELLPEFPVQIFNTWMGDPAKLMLLEAAISVIKKHNLLEVVRETGDYLKSGLVEIEKEFCEHMHSVRGRGTFLGFSLSDAKKRTKFKQKMLSKGIIYGACGDEDIRLRPALIFQKHHADILLEKTREVLKEL